MPGNGTAERAKLLLSAMLRSALHLFPVLVHCLKEETTENLPRSQEKHDWLLWRSDLFNCMATIMSKNRSFPPSPCHRDAYFITRSIIKAVEM
ncbi:hypothetical protein CDAR_492801 [Caerostris darwini]|uniref:Secreted protein n=1 Tax=Caerostris darwini TaxID=1538125 RepID=A0AAV4V010_9ARAC|nr:hypothetical protein CDAR_492801 [Caerostris darwini]